jgi:hypothetical protein
MQWARFKSTVQKAGIKILKQTIQIEVPNEVCGKNPVNIHLISTELRRLDTTTGHKTSQTGIIMFCQVNVNNLANGFLGA